MQIYSRERMDKVKEFIQAYQRENGLSPTYRQIMKDVGLDPATVGRYVKRLEESGDIKRTKLGTIETPRNLITGRTVTAPVVGTVPCGQPQIATEEIECTYTLPADVFGTMEKFILRATGNSMIETGIYPGDLLVVEKRVEARNGEIVIAMIDDFGESNATTKRYYKEKDGKIRLHPENKEMEDLYYDASQVRICGAVVGVIRSYK